MMRVLCVLLAVMMGGCEAKPEPVTTGYFTYNPEQVTLSTLLSGEEKEPTQEEIGMAIVMTARGWSEWPKEEQP